MPTTESSSPRERPNILFLMSDEQRADVLGFAGNKIVRTPVLDELARTGVVFRNAYTPAPACIPARQCLATGKLPKTVGCEGWVDLPPNSRTFMRLFAEYAYQTTCCGRLSYIGPDQMQGFLKRIGSDLNVSPSYLENRRPEEYARYQRAFADYKWSEAKEVRRAGIGKGPGVAHDEYALQGALDYIEEYFASPYYDREMYTPLLLKVSFAQPHYPFLTSEEKFTYYLNRVEPYLDQSFPEHPYLKFRTVREGVDASARDIRRATAAYYGMVETVDEYFGRVLDALRHAGQNLDDWIIIYTSDHGEMLGQQSQWEKIKFHDGSARVPLLIRWPKHFGPRIVDENVNLCDLFATLCELAGLEVPPELDSRSLVPLMRGEDAHWNNETISQFGQKCLMIKRDHLKYQYLYYYDTEYPELLYDLERDPGETHNLIDDPNYAEPLAAFRRRLSELGHGPNPSANYTNAGYNS